MGSPWPASSRPAERSVECGPASRPLTYRAIDQLAAEGLIDARPHRSPVTVRSGRCTC